MNDTLHVIGNGPSATFYKQGSYGRKLTCNIPHFPIPDAYATVMVDFKMMNAINNDGVIPPQPWVLGWRPKKYMEKHQACLLYTSPSPRDISGSRMPSSA